MVGMRDGNGRMPIHIASFKGIDAITQLLLKHGADPSAKDGAGNDGVVLAERSGRRRCVTSPPVTVVRTVWCDQPRVRGWAARPVRNPSAIPISVSVVTSRHLVTSRDLRPTSTPCRYAAGRRRFWRSS